MLIKRFSGSAFAGVFITLTLFYLMQALIASDDEPPKESKIGNLVDFVRVKEDMNLSTKDRKPKKPPPPQEPPPPAPPKFDISVDQDAVNIAQIDMKVDVGGGFGAGDGEYLPIFKVPAMYPRRAQQRGMTGWVIVEFTVTETGSVADPYVVENCAWVKRPGVEEECKDSPSTVFDSSALKSALKYKYKPKMLDGVPKPTPGVQTKIIFQLEDE